MTNLPDDRRFPVVVKLFDVRTSFPTIALKHTPFTIGYTVCVKISEDFVKPLLKTAGLS